MACQNRKNSYNIKSGRYSSIRIDGSLMIWWILRGHRFPLMPIQSPYCQPADIFVLTFQLLGKLYNSEILFQPQVSILYHETQSCVKVKIRIKKTVKRTKHCWKSFSLQYISAVLCIDMSLDRYKMIKYLQTCLISFTLAEAAA